MTPPDEWWEPDGLIRGHAWRMSEYWIKQLFVAKWYDAPCAYRYDQMMAIAWASRPDYEET